MRQLPDVVVLDGRPLTRELLGTVRRLRALKPNTTTLAVCTKLVARSVVEACYEAGADFVVFGTLDLPALLAANQLTPAPPLDPELKLDSSSALEFAQRGHVLDAVGQLAAGIAHELNNQLTAILGFKELLTMHLGPEEVDLNAYANQIEFAAGESRNLVKQLLAFGRRQVMDPRSLKCGSLLEEVARELAPALPEGVELNWSPSEELWPLRVDPAQIKNVVFCLAESAVKAMPEGGVLELTGANVEVSTPDAKPDLGFLAGSYVCLSVRDSGEPLSEEGRQRIFEPFYARSARHGKGLGLAAVYGIVKQSGGWIWVNPTSVGTEFQVYFPRDQKADTTRRLGRRKTAFSPSASGQLRVLVVEDQDPVRTFVRDILGAAGYDVTEAACGEEALELLDVSPSAFDLILTDVAMPGMGGRKFADRARELAQQRVVFMSGHPGNALVECGLLRDGERFLAKPFSGKELISEVEGALSDTPSAGTAVNGNGSHGQA
ncbi:MAG: response regulator [Planctomycetes bacterium]|nr:response regulator [Planctomycetota bacterium]